MYTNRKLARRINKDRDYMRSVHKNKIKSKPIETLPVHVMCVT